MMKKLVKNIIKNSNNIEKVIKWFYRIIYFSRINSRGLNNSISLLGYCKSFRITIIGNNNYIYFSSSSKGKDIHITIRGNDNKIIVGESVYLEEGELFIEDNGNTIAVGNSTTICFGYHIACVEGKRVLIGERCLFSSDVKIRTSDSHSIIDKLTGKRCNDAKSVEIGNHVWLGNNVSILKGSKVSDDCIVGAGSIVTKAIEEKNSILCGIPAKVIKTNVDWCGLRL